MQVVKCSNHLQINPGSATGAYTSGPGPGAPPSFVLMDLEGGRATVYVYQLLGGEVKVEKIDYQKPTTTVAAAPAAAAQPVAAES